MKIQTFSIIERARRYVAMMPEAVSGQHGHSTMFSVACVLVQGFDLNMGDARTLLEEYNVTLTEPFSWRELEHKLQCAAKKQSTKGRGYLLNSSDMPIRARITPKKPADTPPRIIHRIPYGTPRTGASSLFRKTNYKYTTIKRYQRDKIRRPARPKSSGSNGRCSANALTHWCAAYSVQCADSLPILA